MKSSILKPSEPLSIFSFLHNFITAYASNAINEGAETWLLNNFMKKPAKDALSHRMTVIENNITDKDGTLTTFCLTVSYLLQVYATSDALTEAEGAIINYDQS